jgi:hypothetical protein
VWRITRDRDDPGIEAPEERGNELKPGSIEEQGSLTRSDHAPDRDGERSRPRFELGVRKRSCLLSVRA